MPAAINTPPPTAVRGGKLDPLETAFSSAPALAGVYDGLRGIQDPNLTFVPTGSRRARDTAKSEIEREVCELVRQGRLQRIALQYRYDPGFDSRSSQQKIDLKGAAKLHAVAKRAAPHSLSQLVIACEASEVTGEPFASTTSLVTLELGIDGMPSAPGTRQRSSAEKQSLGPRRMTEPVVIEKPDVETAAKMVADFMDAPSQMRAAAIAFAKELNLLPFRNARLGRYMSHFQADALVPFGKAFFGAGIGDTMLKKAMAGPLAAANQAKRCENAVTRDELLYLLWSHAVDNSRTKPPLIIM